MKKIFKLVYIIIFLVMCITPIILMQFIKNDAQIEKKELAKMPDYITNGKINMNYPDEFESWFNDHMPFRSELLSVNNLLKSELLKAPSSNVIVGKDGYLFYTTESKDYMNTNAMTDSEINSVAITMSLMERFVNERNGHFVVVIMPNKSTVYDEYMPSYYKKSAVNNLTRIQDKFLEYNVNYVDMKNVMIQNKDKNIYHKRDSHWNYLGALIGYNAIMDNLQKEHKTYDNLSYKLEKTWRGDLDKLLYPAGGYMDYQYNYDFDYSNYRIVYPMGYASTKMAVENFMSDREDNDSYFISSNKNVSDGRKLFIVRDSFGRALIPFLMDNYKETTFKRSQNPDITSLEENTDMIYEISERNAKDIIKTAPFMYAPERYNIYIPSNSGEVTSDYKIENYGIKLYGEFDDGIEIDDKVYVILNNPDETKIFEAFPIHEEVYENNGRNGYSLYIDKNVLAQNEYEVSIILGNNNYKAKKLILN